MLNLVLFSCIYTNVGLRSQIIYWGLGLVQEHGWSEEEQMVMNGSGLGFNEKGTMGRLSEEEYLLGYDKHSSNMYSNDQSDLS